MMKYLFFLSCLILMFSCDNGTGFAIETPETTEFKLSEPAAALYQIVGEKHDTAMLLMSSIGKVQSVLRIKLQAAETPEAEKKPILEALTALKKADDSMMNWMHEFKSTELNEEEYQAMSEEEIISYLKEEEAKIEQVHLDMKESIRKGKLI